MNINIESEDNNYYEKFKEEISPRTNYGAGYSKNTKLTSLYINGFLWYLDVNQEPKRLYPENNTDSHEGYSIYSNHFTEDERKQIQNFIKYDL